MQNKVVKVLINAHGNVSQTKLRMELIFYTILRTANH